MADDEVIMVEALVQICPLHTLTACYNSTVHLPCQVFARDPLA